MRYGWKIAQTIPPMTVTGPSDSIANARRDRRSISSRSGARSSGPTISELTYASPVFALDGRCKSATDVTPVANPRVGRRATSLRRRKALAEGERLRHGAARTEDGQPVERLVERREVPRRHPPQDRGGLVGPLEPLPSPPEDGKVRSVAVGE